MSVNKPLTDLSEYVSSVDSWQTLDLDQLQTSLSGIDLDAFGYHDFAPIFEHLLKICPKDISELSWLAAALVASNKTFGFGLLLYALNRHNVAPIAIDKQLVPSNPEMTDNQRHAVVSSSPYILVRAGAGTGKSSTVQMRIKQLIKSGVDANNIQVLSFTNAAADHIAQASPGVGSSTIAKMLCAAFEYNFDQLKLNSAGAMAKTIAGLNTDATIFRISFAARLTDVSKNTPGSNLKLVSFVAQNLDAVLRVCQQLNQICLELQTAIAISLGKTFLIPNPYTAEHLIVDEVQDCAVEEFCWLLSYALTNDVQLFLVGDAAQTLYEFRGADPNALAVVEDSGVFTCFNLNTNFRSDGNILALANQVLADVEANRFAKIHLNPHTVSQHEFDQVVKFNFTYTQTRGGCINYDVIDDLYEFVIRDFLPKHCSTGNTAFLCRTRRSADIVNEILREDFPNIETTSLLSDRPTESYVLASFVAKYLPGLQYLNPSRIADAVVETFSDKLSILVADLPSWRRGDAMAQATNLFSYWSSVYYQAMVTIGSQQLKSKNLIDLIGNSLLEVERSFNSGHLGIDNNDPVVIPDSQVPHFYTSTIHGTKGLEFDQAVVLVYADELSQESLRTYYVALTRPRKALYVLGYGQSDRFGIGNFFTQAKDKMIVN